MVDVNRQQVAPNTISSSSPKPQDDGAEMSQPMKEIFNHPSGLPSRLTLQVWLSSSATIRAESPGGGDEWTVLPLSYANVQGKGGKVD